MYKPSTCVNLLSVACVSMVVLSISQNVRNPAQKSKDVLERLQRLRQRAALESFLAALEESYNVGLSIKLRNDLHDDWDAVDNTSTGRCAGEGGGGRGEGVGVRGEGGGVLLW